MLEQPEWLPGMLRVSDVPLRREELQASEVPTRRSVMALHSM